MNIREKALEFATKAHSGQKRKDGKDYITHPVAVAKIAKRLGDKWSLVHPSYYDDLYVLSVAHDLGEDQPQSMAEFREIFGDYLADAVQKLSRRKGETYFDFISRIGGQDDAIPIIVKIADLEHNMSDLQEGSMKDKYRFAHYFLSQVLGG